MKRTKVIKCLTVAFAAGVALCSNGGDLTLTLGDFAFMPADLTAGGPQSPIEYLVDQGDTLDFTAEVESAVTVGNHYGPSALTFWYRVANLPDASRPIGGLSILPSEALNEVRVNQTADSFKHASYASLDIGGGVVGFTWAGSNVILPGTISSWVMVKTPFQSYTAAFVGVQGGFTANVAALVPAGTPATFGDLTGDTVVNRDDVALITTAIRTHNAQEWNDVNDDGKVDAADARWLALHQTP